MTANKFKIIGLLIDVERATGELYNMFSQKFAAHSDVWHSLAREEEQHIAMIRALSAHVAEGLTRYIAAVDEEELKKQFEAIESAKERMASGEITEKEAIRVALEIETTMMEFPFHEVFEATDTSTKKFIDGIVGAEERHRQAIEELARKEL